MSYAADAIVEEDRPLTLLDGFRLLPGGVGGLLLGGAIGMFLEWRIGETYLPYHPNRLAVLAALGIACRSSKYFGQGRLFAKRQFWVSA